MFNVALSFYVGKMWVTIVAANFMAFLEIVVGVKFFTSAGELIWICWHYNVKAVILSNNVYVLCSVCDTLSLWWGSWSIVWDLFVQVCRELNFIWRVCIFMWYLLTEGINCAGVKWVIRLQLILLLMLFIAVLDFTVGSFVHTDPGYLCSVFEYCIVDVLSVIATTL